MLTGLKKRIKHVPDGLTLASRAMRQKLAIHLCFFYFCRVKLHETFRLPLRQHHNISLGAVSSRCLPVMIYEIISLEQLWSGAPAEQQQHTSFLSSLASHCSSLLNRSCFFFSPQQSPFQSEEKASIGAVNTLELEVTPADC